MRSLGIAATCGVASLMLAACGTQSASDGGETAALNDAAPSAQTQVITTQTAATSEEDWGTFREYFAGETAGVTDLLSGTATIAPGMEIHPPHSHSEEEFLMVVEGSGEWTVGEETFAASEGDMLYAAAWDLHGITNTGDTPLTFVFWKWNSRGVPVPADPQAE